MISLMTISPCRANWFADPKLAVEKGRLQPVRMFLVDFEQGRLIPDEEIKKDIASSRPYAQWLREQRIELRELPLGQLLPADETIVHI